MLRPQIPCGTCFSRVFLLCRLCENPEHQCTAQKTYYKMRFYVKSGSANHTNICEIHVRARSSFLVAGCHTACVGPALAGKASAVTPQIHCAHTGLFPAEAGPTKSIACIQSDWLKPECCDRISPVGPGRRQQSHPKIDCAHTGLFPAEAGPTKSIACIQCDRLKAECWGGIFPGGTCFSREDVGTDEENASDGPAFS
jgi:hypothetical protein